MIRAWVIGFMILLAVVMMVVIATLIEVYPRALLLLLQISPFVAAFVSAYLAPRKKIILGTSMAIPAAILSVAVTFAYQLFGKDVDFPGLRGGLILFTVTITYSCILCLLGSIAGNFLSKKRQRGQNKKSVS